MDVPASHVLLGGRKHAVEQRRVRKCALKVGNNPKLTVNISLSVVEGVGLERRKVVLVVSARTHARLLCGQRQTCGSHVVARPSWGPALQRVSLY